jgi:hypothetical protein
MQWGELVDGRGHRDPRDTRRMKRGSPRRSRRLCVKQLRGSCSSPRLGVRILGNQIFLTPRHGARRAEPIAVPRLPRRARREIAFSFEAPWWPQPRCGWFGRWEQTQGCPRSSANPGLGVSTPLALAGHRANQLQQPTSPRRSRRPCVKQRPGSFAASRLRVSFQCTGACRVCRPAGADDPSGRGTHG